MAGRVGENAADGALFDRPEPTAKPQKSTLLLWQFFLFPLLIVICAVGVFLLFGAFAGSDKSPHEMAETLLAGGDNERRQAGHQLAQAVARAAVEARRSPDPENPPFFVDPAFRDTLRRAFRRAFAEDEGADHQRLLALTMGRTGDPAAVGLLGDVLYPPNGKMHPDTVRRGAVQGLAFMEDRIAEPLLARAAGDPHDAQVRALALSGLALFGLARHGGPAKDAPETKAALREGLTDSLGGARLNAAYGLAIRGVDEPAIRALVAQSLDRAQLEELGVPDAFQAQALRNGARAAARLGGQKLKDAVQRLTSTDREGDDKVRGFARQALDHWPEAPPPTAMGALDGEDEHGEG